MSRYNDFLTAVGNQTIICNNLGFGEQGAVLKEMESALVICADIEKARKLKLQLQALKKNCVVIDHFDNPYTLSKFQSNDSRTDILKALYQLSLGKVIVLSTAQILNINIPTLENFSKHILKIEKNKDYSLEELEKQLFF